jgi:hypothetical protein
MPESVTDQPTRKTYSSRGTHTEHPTPNLSGNFRKRRKTFSARRSWKSMAEKYVYWLGSLKHWRRSAAKGREHIKNGTKNSSHLSMEDYVADCEKNIKNAEAHLEKLGIPIPPE